MILRAALAVLLLASAALPARADEPAPDDTELVPGRQLPPGVREAPQEDQTPAALRWMLKPLSRGMFIRLPVIDTDPNRGITYGVMPIVVLQGKKDDRIEQIYAPSVTYNRYFQVSPTFRYYYYPQEDASFVARFSTAKYEHEGMLEYGDHSVFGSPYDVLFRAQENQDAGQHFFGLGPDSAQRAEANYKQQYWQFRWAFGAPIGGRSSPVRWHLTQRYMTSRVLNGPIPGLPDFDDSFPAQFSERAQQTTETRATLDYDTRDHAVTTGRGALLEAYAEASVRGFASQYDYDRYGLDARWFKPWERLPGQALAVQWQFEQTLGPTPPFWLEPSLGGKYSLRAYGDGRYVDRGMTAINVEERIKLLEQKTAGVTTEFQLAPFAGLGTVFNGPTQASARFARPVVGAAIRAVAKPQVVGSVDFGVGREGLAVFMDINYSF